MLTGATALSTANFFPLAPGPRLKMPRWGRWVMAGAFLFLLLPSSLWILSGADYEEEVSEDLVSQGVVGQQFQFLGRRRGEALNRTSFPVKEGINRQKEPAPVYLKGMPIMSSTGGRTVLSLTSPQRAKGTPPHCSTLLLATLPVSSTAKLAHICLSCREARNALGIFSHKTATKKQAKRAGTFRA